MHILITADGRSPITQNWIHSVLKLGYQVTLVSTYPCEDLPGVENTIRFPVAFGGFASAGRTSGGMRRMIRGFRPLIQLFRNSFAPTMMRNAGHRFQKLLEGIKPDLVHALRIPYEGILASHTPPGIPLVVTIWGNDLTLHAPASRGLGRWTRQTLQRADALLADARRDIRLAVQWGFDPSHPTMVLPGSGGVDLDRIKTVAGEPLQSPHTRDIPRDDTWIINPRGIRAYARTDVFFQSIPLLLNRWQNVRFLCTGMAGRNEADVWVQRLKLQDRVHLLPVLPQEELWRLFQRSMISLSITEHDGTPNTLLEAMACGCLPIAGDLETLREWITPGVNGLLVNPCQPQGVADGMMLALTNPSFVRKAAEMNEKIILERADCREVQSMLGTFYNSIHTVCSIL